MFLLTASKLRFILLTCHCVFSAPCPIYFSFSKAYWWVRETVHIHTFSKYLNAFCSVLRGVSREQMKPTSLPLAAYILLGKNRKQIYKWMKYTVCQLKRIVGGNKKKGIESIKGLPIGEGDLSHKPRGNVAARQRERQVQSCVATSCAWRTARRPVQLKWSRWGQSRTWTQRGNGANRGCCKDVS